MVSKPVGSWLINVTNVSAWSVKLHIANIDKSNINLLARTCIPMNTEFPVKPSSKIQFDLIYNNKFRSIIISHVKFS